MMFQTGWDYQKEKLPNFFIDSYTPPYGIIPLERMEDRVDKDITYGTHILLSQIADALGVPHDTTPMDNADLYRELIDKAQRLAEAVQEAQDRALRWEAEAADTWDAAEKLANMLGEQVLGEEDAATILHRLIPKIAAHLMPDGMEWPRFEDRELVKLGDKFLTDRGNEGTTYRIEFMERQTNVWQLEGGVVGFVVLTSGGRVKRPPILAKDGKPIEVGQRLYGEDGRMWEVLGLHHGKRYPVEGWRIVVPTGDKIEKRLKAEWLTHEKPEPVDTWERLEMEAHIADMLAADEYAPIGEADDRVLFVQRAKALAERGADTGIDRLGEVE